MKKEYLEVPMCRLALVIIQCFEDANLHEAYIHDKFLQLSNFSSDEHVFSWALMYLDDRNLAQLGKRCGISFTELMMAKSMWRKLGQLNLNVAIGPDWSTPTD